MEAVFEVAVLVGSLRKLGFSRQIANILIARAPASLSMRIVPIGSLPLYNQDEEAAPPAEHAEFRAALRRADGVLFVTPEYNRGVPGGLKNAIDVGSRPYGASVFEGLPAAVVSQSPGSMGGPLANHALRPTLMFLNMPTLAQPEIYLGHVGALVDDAGALKEEGTAALIDNFLSAFAEWVRLHAPKKMRGELAA